MKIAVCVKQVPSDNKSLMDKKSGTLIRNGETSVINPYDLFAVEMALRIRERVGGEVFAFTMGADSAKKVLIDSVAMGVDGGYLVSDLAFAGADVFATAKTLSEAIIFVGGFDLVICGRQTTDGDTGEVGIALATHMNICGLPFVNEVVEIDEKNITASCDFGKHNAITKCPLPAVISVDKDCGLPRIPTLRGKLSAKKAVFPVISLDELLDKNKDNYGLSGSKTSVLRIYNTVFETSNNIIKEGGLEFLKGKFESIKKGDL